MRRLLAVLAAAGALLAALPGAASAQATDPSPAQVHMDFAATFRAPGSVTGTTAFRVQSANDVSGIAGVWLRIDGQSAGYVQIPCPNGTCAALTTPVDLPVDTTKLTEEPHTFTVGVVDGDGWWTTGHTRVLRVDRTAPPAPVPLTPQQINTTAERVVLAWTVPGEPAIAQSLGTICDVQGCRPMTNFLRPLGADLRVQLGVTTITVWVRDEAGNVDPARTTTWTINRTRGVIAKRTDPGLSIATAKVGRDRRTVTVGGLLRIAHTNKVSVSIMARYGKRTRTVRVIAVTSGNGWATRLKLPSARWTSATVIARVAGTGRYLTVEKRKAIRRR